MLQLKIQAQNTLNATTKQS